MKKGTGGSLFEKKMANKKFREEFKKDYPLFELEVQKRKELKEELTFLDGN